MLRTLGKARGRAINLDGKSAVETPTDGRFAVNDENWFSDAARQLYPSKPGTSLHYLTGFDERLCQRYAERGPRPTKPSAYFLRALLRGNHGDQWLAATMDNCQAQWWLDLQHEREIGRDTIARVNRK